MACGWTVRRLAPLGTSLLSPCPAGVAARGARLRPRPCRAEPIQSRCAVLRYTKLTDAQILARLLSVIEKENVPHTDDGLEAIIFTAQGDMRQVRGGARRGRGPGRRGAALELTRPCLLTPAPRR